MNSREVAETASESKRPGGWKDLPLPEFISNDTLHDLIKNITCSINFRIFSGRNRSLLSDSVRE